MLPAMSSGILSEGLGLRAGAHLLSQPQHGFPVKKKQTKQNKKKPLRFLPSLFAFSVQIQIQQLLGILNLGIDGLSHQVFLSTLIWLFIIVQMVLA